MWCVYLYEVIRRRNTLRRSFLGQLFAFWILNSLSNNFSLFPTFFCLSLSLSPVHSCNKTEWHKQAWQLLAEIYSLFYYIGFYSWRVSSRHICRIWKKEACVCVCDATFKNVHTTNWFTNRSELGVSLSPLMLATDSLLIFLCIRLWLGF